MEKVTLSVIASSFGNWVSYQENATFKYEIAIGRSILESHTQYKTIYSAWNAGRRMVKHLGYTEKVEDGCSEVWGKKIKENIND